MSAVDQDMLKTLLEFGYDEPQAVRALRATGNASIEQAAEWLANPRGGGGAPGAAAAPAPTPVPAPAPAPPPAAAAGGDRQAQIEAGRQRYIEEQKRKKEEKRFKEMERKRLDEQRANFAARQGKPAAGGGGAAAGGGGGDDLAALRAERAKQHSERVEREKARQAKEDRDAREAAERQARAQADHESQLRQAEKERKKFREQQKQDAQLQSQMRREESSRREQLRREREAKEQQQAAARERAQRQQAAAREEAARAAEASRQPYSEAAAAALLSGVGFEQEQVVATLAEYGGNIRLALQALLSKGAAVAAAAPGDAHPHGAADSDGQWWGVDAIEREAHGILLRLAKGRRQDFKEMRRRRFTESKQKCLADHEDIAQWKPELPMIRDLDWKLGWADSDRDRYADFRVKLNDIVGMAPVKELIEDTIHDAVGRKGSGEVGGSFHYRHIMLAGSEGTGKKTAADLVGHLSAVVGAVTDPSRWEPQQTRYFVPLGSLGDLDPETVARKTVYYVQQPAAPSAADAAVLQEMIAQGSFCILAGAAPLLQKWARQPCMKRDDRSRLIDLPTLGVPELAAITVQLVEEKGYQLSADGKTDLSGGGLDKSVMEYIVRQTYNDAAIRDNNANLAATMIQRAITRKNARVEREGLGAGRLTLTPQDFGVEMQTDEELQAIKEDVLKEVDQLWGEGAMEGAESEPESDAPTVPIRGLLASSPMVPTVFFNDRLKLKLGEVTSELAAGKARRDNWNVLVTGNSGVGKTTFAKLLAKYLKACRILPRDVVVEKQVGQLQDEETKKLMTQGGCLVIDIDSLMGGAFSGRDNLDAEQVAAVKTALAATVAKPVVCVLAGKWDTAARILHMDAQMDSGIVISLPRQVNIADFPPEKVATIAEDLARVEKDCTFEDGLWEKLSHHISERYDDMGTAGNARLARKLVENAERWREERVFGAAMAMGSQADGEGVSREFIASDFNMDAKLTEERLKVEVDRDIQDLIGMEEAKRSFEQVKAKVRYVEKTGDKSALKTCLNLVITGNPGTGKTMFSRLLYRFMRAYGVLKSDHEVFVERNGLELKGQFLGDTAPKVKRAVREALGGCLFIDEAYALAEGGGDPGGGGDSFAKDAIRTLLTEVENNRTSVMVVLAGYKDKMARLMRMDPGLDRRFPQRLHLHDYSKEQLAQVCQVKARVSRRPGLRRCASTCLTALCRM